jgi:predicted TIM-barrel fold metal-dependent hydrolase
MTFCDDEFRVPARLPEVSDAGRVGPVSIFRESKIDCHNHVLDPNRFPFADTFYTPSGPELSSVEQLLEVFDAYGVAHGLLVTPNAGYGLGNNGCMLDALERANGRLKGIALLSNDTSTEELARLKESGVIGLAINTVLMGRDFYDDAGPLFDRLAALDMFVDIQIERDQLLTLAQLLERSGVRVLIDHCGRPDPGDGLDQPGFQARLGLAKSGRTVVKLSGYVKFSRAPHPYPDTWPYVDALLDGFGPEGCVWASDWPFLRAPRRIDYGPLLGLFERLVPDPADRRKVLWDTPRRLLGVGGDLGA